MIWYLGLQWNIQQNEQEVQFSLIQVQSKYLKNHSDFLVEIKCAVLFKSTFVSSSNQYFVNISTQFYKSIVFLAKKKQLKNVGHECTNNRQKKICKKVCKILRIGFHYLECGI